MFMYVYVFLCIFSLLLSVSINAFAGNNSPGGLRPPGPPFYSAVGPQIGSEMVSKLKTRYELRIPPLGMLKIAFK